MSRIFKNISTGIFILPWDLMGLFLQCRVGCVYIYNLWSLNSLCVHVSLSANVFLLFGHFKSNLSVFPSSPSLCLWSNKEISLGAKYFPLWVFKHSGSLLLFLSASEVFSFLLAVSVLFPSLPVVVCVSKAVAELRWHGDCGKHGEIIRTVRGFITAVSRATLTVKVLCMHVEGG